MIFVTERSILSGTARIPGSKSHTIRAVLLAAMAEGESHIRDPLLSGDTRSALTTAQCLGARVKELPREWQIQGVGGKPRGSGTIDVGNSGTTLYFALALASLMEEGEVVFDGDEQTRRRSAANLIASLRDLGADVEALGANGCCPIRVRGGLRGGKTSMACPTSQYLSALLLASPLAPQDTTIDVPLLYEHPYIEMTLVWLKRLRIRLDCRPDFSHFQIPGSQRYRSFDASIPGDFSSATFLLCAAAITGSELLLQGLDLHDPQGDKAVVDYLRAMGAEIESVPEGLRVRGGASLRGSELDLNATPDALPAMAVTAAVAKGRTTLRNVPQARMKETDRIAVMAKELRKLGIQVEELPDGLIIEGGALRGGTVHGHGDHRVVMAFAIAGLASAQPISVDTAEAASITFPGFAELLTSLGGRIRVCE